MSHEGLVEDLKRELSKREDFTLAGAFNLFTGYSQTRIVGSDFLFGLERLGVKADIADAKLVVGRYDSDLDQRLGFWEFSSIFLPIDTLLRDDLERRKAVWDIGFETKELIRRLLRKILDQESMIEGIRQRIRREPSINLRKAYDALDCFNRGFISTAEIQRSFDIASQTYQTQSLARIDNTEVECYIRRFNKDKLNGRISMTEFIDELTPKSIEKPY